MTNRVFIRRAFTQKPKSFLRPNLRHPHLADVRAWWAILDGSGPSIRDVTEKRGSLSLVGSAGDMLWDVCDQGICLARSDSSGDYYTLGNETSGVSDPLAIEIIGDWPTATGGGIFSWGNTSGSTNPNIFIQRRTGDLRYLINGGYRFTVSYPSGGGNLHILLTYNPGDGWYLYHNGIQVGYYAAVVKTSGQTNLYLASGYQGQINGDYVSLRIWDRYFSEAEAADIYRNPWAAYERRIWVPRVTEAPPAGDVPPLHYHHRHHNLAG